MTPRIVVFTDLDGTLLDARTYSFAEARDALDELRLRQVPLVVVSSKTSAEIEEVRRRLGNEHPFVAENGGGIFIPRGYYPFPVAGEVRGPYQVQVLGAAYGAIRDVFERLRNRLGVDARGFGDMTAMEISGLTGLEKGDAELARKREFDEPFVFGGSPDEAFLTAVEREGFRWTRGRIYHIMGNSDKGRAVRVLRDLYARVLGAVTTMGIGDGLNDLAMLEAVDHPVLVRRDDGVHDPDVMVTGLIRTEGIGPRGWSEAVRAFLASRASRRG